MKKMILFAGCLLLAGVAFAASKTLTFDVAGTNAVAKTTTIRGDVATIFVDVPSGATGTVAVVTDSGETLLNKSSISADSTFHPVVQSCGSDGAAISNQYQRAAVGGPVTITVTGTGTNTVTYKVGVVY